MEKTSKQLAMRLFMLMIAGVALLFCVIQMDMNRREISRWLSPYQTFVLPANEKMNAQLIEAWDDGWLKKDEEYKILLEQNSSCGHVGYERYQQCLAKIQAKLLEEPGRSKRLHEEIYNRAKFDYDWNKYKSLDTFATWLFGGIALMLSVLGLKTLWQLVAPVLAAAKLRARVLTPSVQKLEEMRRDRDVARATETLGNLKQLHESGVLSDDDFEKKKTELRGSLIQDAPAT